MKESGKIQKTKSKLGELAFREGGLGRNSINASKKRISVNINFSRI
jgi:hypothetical protein